MGRQGGRGHLKRESSPKFWPVQRKKFTFAVKPIPGPHAIQESVPLQIVIREMLGLAKTKGEAKKIISQGKIAVDGKIRRDEHFPTGLMDIISIPEIKKIYRVIPSAKGLLLHLINHDESDFKLCRIEDKNTQKDGNIQISFHDGRNLLIRSDTLATSKDVYQTYETLKMSLPGQEILDHVKLEKGKSALFIGGKNVGKYGVIAFIEERADQKREDLLVTVEDEKGQTFQTTLNHVFVVGDKKPLVSLPGSEDQ